MGISCFILIELFSFKMFVVIVCISLGFVLSSIALKLSG
jgi:hypothetical protein